MGIVVIGASFVDVKGYPLSQYIPGGRNVGRVVQVHGGVARNVVEDIANVELRPTFVSVVDDTGLSDDVVRNLIRHKVDIRYVARSSEGLGTWLAVFDNDGDVIASISGADPQEGAGACGKARQGSVHRDLQYVDCHEAP